MGSNQTLLFGGVCSLSRARSWCGWLLSRAEVSPIIVHWLPNLADADPTPTRREHSVSVTERAGGGRISITRPPFVLRRPGRLCPPFFPPVFSSCAGALFPAPFRGGGGTKRRARRARPTATRAWDLVVVPSWVPKLHPGRPGQGRRERVTALGHTTAHRRWHCTRYKLARIMHSCGAWPCVSSVVLDCCLLVI